LNIDIPTDEEYEKRVLDHKRRLDKIEKYLDSI